MKVRIVKNPVGLYNLAYEPGDEIHLPDSQARELIETGHAERIGDDFVETAESKVVTEKAIRKRK
jgi:hypothetical protein